MQWDIVVEESVEYVEHLQVQVPIRRNKKIESFLSAAHFDEPCIPVRIDPKCAGKKLFLRNVISGDNEWTRLEVSNNNFSDCLLLGVLVKNTCTALIYS